MATLSKEYRKLLENVVVAARIAAVAGARKALVALRVGEKDAPVEPEKRVFRNQLRAHGRQLGDRLRNDGIQETTRLEQACAYEHWHRMLFARFLAENNLLLHPEYEVAMSLAEIQEEARGKGQDWLSLASDYAQRMLIEVFRPDDPVLQVVMPPETRQELDEKLAQLPPEIFLAEDSLGWVYQFWQRDEKERVNKSEVKIGADELSPVTQLFTEDYMVLFLLHNTLGAWWTAKRCSEGKDSTLHGYEWTYLRLNEDGSPAAGSFAGWPRTARELLVLDPCMGSGHFLTFALPILTRMRMEEEGTTLAEAIRDVLSQNLFGLELDARCSQIAAFNLGLASWRMVGRPIPLPAMNLACSGLGINASKESWAALAGENGLLQDTLRELYVTFQKAPTLGSLVDPMRVGRPLLIAKFEEVWPLLERALAVEQQTDESRELAIAARGVLSAARILSSRFTLVATNVPYLGRGKQNDTLKEFCEEFYSEAKADLATSFVDRCLRLCSAGGSVCLVTPQNWLFLTGYSRFRERLLKELQWNLVVRLGSRAFETITGEVVNIALIGLTQDSPGATQTFAGWDAGGSKTPSGKIAALVTSEIYKMDQKAQLSNPDRRLILDQTHDATGGFAKHTQSFQGAVTGDLERFTAFAWEIADYVDIWEPFRTAVSSSEIDDGLMCAIRWQKGSGDLARYAQETRDQLHDMHESGRKAWGKKGVAINRMRGLYATLYDGAKFDNNVAVLIPDEPSDLLPILCFCQSEEFARSVRSLDQTLKVTNQTLRKVAFDIARWRGVAATKFPDGYPTKQPDDLTQWLFDGRPKASARPLHVAVARLLGYRWPRQIGFRFSEYPSLEEDGIEVHADSDGIVCLASLSGEAPAADRLRALLADAYGAEWSAEKLAEILNGCNSLELWLRDHFFAEHCEIFHDRPFIWHIWDGRKDGFHALVNYHKLAGANGEGRRTLERLLYTSLGDWISRQRAEVANGADGAEARLSAALHLQIELKNILRGDPPYDLFVRWKPIREQAIGWEPDLNDGVRLNMRPWLMAKPYLPTKRDACILRTTPIGLPLGKDRGKEPMRDETDFPWFAVSSERTNDIHLAIDDKRKARELKKA